MPYTPWPVYGNNPSTTIAVNGYQGGAATAGAPASGTVETWTVTSSASFPAAALFPGATQIHIADPAAPSEVITVYAISGTTWTVNRGAEGRTPVTHAAQATFVQVVSAGDMSSAQYLPWQFPVEAYGAVCDGKVIADVVLNSTTTITSATANFVTGATPAGDVGKYIMINGGAGATSAPLVTTIASVTNATTAVLANAATVTGTAYIAIYGTDDTAAINSAMAAAKTYALANGYFAELLLGAKYHILSSGPTQSTSPQYNAQIPVPYPDLTGTGRKLVIVITGTGDGAYPDYWESLVPNIAGSALISMTTAPQTPSGTYGQQSVLGGPSGGAAFTGNYANTKVHVRGMTIVCGAYTNQVAYDFSYLACMRAEQSSAHIFAPTGVNGGVEPTLQTIFPTTAFINSIGTGFRSPVALNNAEIISDDLVTEGFTNSFWVADHFMATRLQGMYTSHLLTIDTTLGTNLQYPITVLHLDAEAYLSCIWVQGGGSGNVPVYINVASEYSGASAGTSELYDPGSALHGVIHWAYPTDATRYPQISGAQNVKFINDSLGPGVWTGAMHPAVPAVPATTVAQVNSAWRDATVYITWVAGVISVIAVDATTTGLTLSAAGAVAVRVPSGHSVTLTYNSTAPTWTWILE